MIKLLISYIDDRPGNSKDQYLMSYQADVIGYASHYRQRAAFTFALDLWPVNSPINSIGHVLRKSLVSIPWPDIYERVEAISGPVYPFDLRDPISASTRCLDRSIAFNRLEMVRYLLNKGAIINHPKGRGDKNAYNHRPLLQAVLNRDETITKILLDAGADPNWYGPTGTALMAAAFRGSTAIAKLLLDHGANTDEGFPPPIAIAVFRENLDIFRLLREHNARLDTPETGGWAMAVASLHGLSSMEDLLASQGVDKNDDKLRGIVLGPHSLWWYNRLWPILARGREGELA